jgi:hypothetical protein
MKDRGAIFFLTVSGLKFISYYHLHELIRQFLLIMFFLKKIRMRALNLQNLQKNTVYTFDYQLEKLHEVVRNLWSILKRIPRGFG